MAQNAPTTFSDGKPNETENAIAQPVISANSPRQDQNARPPRLRNLRALLLRENVDFALVVGKVDVMRVGVTFIDGGQDNKTFSVGDEDGCFVIIHLTDNPENAGDGFVDLPPTP